MQACNRDNKLKSKFFVIISKVEFYISSEKIMLNVEIDKFKLLLWSKKLI